MSYIKQMEEYLQKFFTPNRLKHIMLLVSYMAKFLELREPYVRILLTSFLTQIFDEKTDIEAKIENTLSYADIPTVRIPKTLF